MTTGCSSMRRARLTAADLDEAADDPALADCCRRDLEQQAKSNRLVNELRRNDRTTERSKGISIAFDTLLRLTELERLRHQRMQQMRAEAARRRDAAALQYGVLHEAPQEDALAIMQLAQLCVCHMVGGGAAADEALDTALQSLACLHQDVVFLRAPFEHDGPLAQHCRMPGPGLVCLRDGNPIAAGPHQAFAAGGSLPHSDAIIAWLQRTGLLIAHLDTPPEAPPAALDMEDSEAEDWEEPCAICGRTYTHQHVGTMAQQSCWDDQR